ncbi:hypothetical protein [Kitasatospora sp. NPDC002965]|uniref:hypothetical protein n=1 Tax=Kitasatospora sp. NPDC002965 TaxID=3154775 RepID=UPI0033A6D69B
MADQGVAEGDRHGHGGGAVPDPRTLPPWSAPEPQQLPDWRADLINYTSSVTGMQMLAQAINAGKATMIPRVPTAGTTYSAGAIGSQLLARLEVQRLEQARLYYATADMVSLSLAAAATPPTEPVRENRLPADQGFMLFESPIGGYSINLSEAMSGTGFTVPGPDLSLTSPIVAVSWSTWTPDSARVDGRPGSVEWLNQDAHGDLRRLDPATRGVWMTFYAASGTPYDLLPPDLVASVGPDGTEVTAGLLATTPGTGPISWDNEVVLAYGVPFGEAAPDSTMRWAQIVYTAWQLMAQQGNAQFTELETVPRPRHGQKRDRRANIPDDSAVRIVNVHTRHRPPRAAAEQDAQASTGRREPQWTCRWPVRPYRRYTCLSPRTHEAGDCEHEDRIVPGHIKGPADKPLRLSDTVNLWNHQP